jgi:hypothetical protein
MINPFFTPGSDLFENPDWNTANLKNFDPKAWSNGMDVLIEEL